MIFGVWKRPRFFAKESCCARRARAHLELAATYAENELDSAEQHLLTALSEGQVIGDRRQSRQRRIRFGEYGGGGP